MGHPIQESAFKQCFSSIFFFLLSIFLSILYYLTKYGFKGSQLQHVSRAVWRCFKHDEENVMNSFEAILRQLKNVDLF